jgi:hypothetical protein
MNRQSKIAYSLSANKISSGTLTLKTNIVIIIANTPSVSDSSRPLLKIKPFLSVFMPKKSNIYYNMFEKD